MNFYFPQSPSFFEKPGQVIFTINTSPTEWEHAYINCFLFIISCVQYRKVHLTAMYVVHQINDSMLLWVKYVQYVFSEAA